jgi:hypothetical protein
MTPKNVREQLEQKGYTYRSFAKKHGFREHNVSKAVHRWAGRATGFPGGHAFRICTLISRIIGEPITPVLAQIKLTYKRKPKA